MHTKLAEIKKCPVEACGAVGSECTNVDTAVLVQPPHSISAGGQLHNLDICGQLDSEGAHLEVLVPNAEQVFSALTQPKKASYREKIYN